jgi:hypothetical protein
MTTFINGCGCKITIDEDIDSVEELEGNAKHLVSRSDDWRKVEE